MLQCPVRDLTLSIVSREGVEIDFRDDRYRDDRSSRRKKRWSSFLEELFDFD